MREILFRGKSSSGEWVYGTPTFSGIDNEVVFMLQPPLPDRYVSPETVGQFTGLTDKNGTKIFEGDIIITEGIWKYLVCFEDGAFGYRDTRGTFWAFADSEYYTPGDEVRVIGNIHDNPKLMKLDESSVL